MSGSSELHSPPKTDDTSWVPRVEMEFNSDDEAYQFYNNYARVVGFSVRKAWINRRTSGVIISRTYVCSKEGYQGNKKDESEVSKPRENERTGCLAHMTIKITTKCKYYVTEFHPMHNHDLVPPTKAHLLKSHRVGHKVRQVGSNAKKGKIEDMVRQAGGYRQVTFVSVEDAADKSWTPKVDMEFENDHKAHQFYCDYGRRIGFDVRKAWVNRKASGVVISRTYVCYKEGYYGNKKDESEVKEHRLRPNERTGCQARMVIKLAKNGRYRVTEFLPMHNHGFITARMAHTLKSNRAPCKAKAAMVVEDLRLTHLPSDEFVVEQEGTQGLPTFHSVEYKNYIPSKRRHAPKIGDAGALMQYMQERQADDPSFYYAVQLDREDKITNVFWADGKSTIDFTYFGDVVCFDTTYKTFDYGRPFAPFYGANHHKQIVFFGAALLYDETEDSFKWLFETFMVAMHGKQPKVLLTGQNGAIVNAMTSVWKDTTHRICVWHVYHNTSKHLCQVFQGSRTFACDFSRCIYDCEEDDEFISSWEKMLSKYDLKGNEWLNQLFEDREKWALAYHREVFYGDIKSIQHRENLNIVLKEHLSPERDLLQFLNRYEKIVDERRDTELQSDLHSTQTTSLIAPSRMLKQAANIYTPIMFNMFQMEFEMSLDCMVYNCGMIGTIFEYRVTTEENPKEHLVRFDALDGNFLCSCKKFEFMGIQCRHVLKALDILNIKELPQQYFLKRWTKDAKVGSFSDGHHSIAGDVNPKLARATRNRSLCCIFSKIAARASETFEGYKFVENKSDQLMDNVYQILQARPPKEPQFS